MDEDLQDQLFRNKVERARRMSPLEKFVAGQELFELGCQQMLGNIRGQMPEADAPTRSAELRRRLAIARRLDRAKLAETYRG